MKKLFITTALVATISTNAFATKFTDSFNDYTTNQPIANSKSKSNSEAVGVGVGIAGAISDSKSKSKSISDANSKSKSKAINKNDIDIEGDKNINKNRNTNDNTIKNKIEGDKNIIKNDLINEGNKNKVANNADNSSNQEQDQNVDNDILIEGDYYKESKIPVNSAVAPAVFSSMCTKGGSGAVSLRDISVSWGFSSREEFCTFMVELDILEKLFGYESARVHVCLNNENMTRTLAVGRIYKCPTEKVKNVESYTSQCDKTAFPPYDKC